MHTFCGLLIIKYLPAQHCSDSILGDNWSAMALVFFKSISCYQHGEELRITTLEGGSKEEETTSLWPNMRPPAPHRCSSDSEHFGVREREAGFRESSPLLNKSGLWVLLTLTQWITRTSPWTESSLRDRAILFIPEDLAHGGCFLNVEKMN